MEIAHDMHKPSLADLTEHIARNTAAYEDRERRIADCQVEASDCSLSMWANDSTADKLRKQLELAQNDWKAKFQVLYQNGQRVNGRIVTFQSRFHHGTDSKWLIDGKFYPKYATYEHLTPRRLANFKKLGFEWREELLPAHLCQSFGSYVGSPVHAYAMPDDRTVIAH